MNAPPIKTHALPPLLFFLLGLALFLLLLARRRPHALRRRRLLLLGVRRHLGAKLVDGRVRKRFKAFEREPHQRVPIERVCRMSLATSSIARYNLVS